MARHAPPLLGVEPLHSVLCDAPAFMAVIDLATYPKDLPDWDYGSISTHVLRAMNAGSAAAFGCPGDPVTIRVSRAPLGADELRRSTAAFTVRFVSSGLISLSGYTSITMAAQFPEQRLPQPGDHALRLAPGPYDVTIARMFEHREGFETGDDVPPDGNHYLIAMVAAAAAAPPVLSRIPWSP